MTALPTFRGDRACAAAPQLRADRRELALVALERTRTPIVVTDPRLPDNPIVLANQAFLDLTGRSADEVIGQNCRFLQGPGTDRELVGQIRDAIANEAECEVEILNYRKDGSTFWNSLQLSPIHDEFGELIYFFASQRDVTKQREVEALEAVERQLLMEVDHRAKNALALVQAIARLTKAETAETYKAAVQRRVEAIARAHDLLAARRWSRAPLEEIIACEVSTSPQVNVRGPSVELPAPQVQPFMLFLHEMISNAALHGALSKPAGTVCIDWRTDGGPKPQLSLHWRECGGPPPASSRKDGFGSFMIKAVVERQLRGKIDMDWPADGLLAEFVIPLDPPAAPPPAQP